MKSSEIFKAGKFLRTKKGRGYIGRFVPFCKVVVVAGQTPVFQWF